MTYQQIKSFINTYIVQNGVNAITGSQLNTALNELADYKGFDSVVVTTLPAGSDATATVQGMTLVLGIPKGADGRDGIDGQDAVNPFKGWFDANITGEVGSKVTDDTANLPANPVVGDYAYVKTLDISGTAPSQTEIPIVKIYECTAIGTWNDSGRTADTSNVQTFASGQEVNEVSIDDTNLENPPANSVAKASDVAPLKSKLKDVTYEETIYNVSNNGIETQDSVYVNGNTGEFKNGSSIYQRTAIINVTGLSKITILAPYSISLNVNWGWGFYETDEDTFAISGRHGIFDSGASVFSSKEYTLDVPENATVLRYTFSRNSTNTQGYNGIPTSDLYAKTQTGDSITDMIENAVDELEEETDGKFESVDESIEEINDILLKEVYVEQHTQIPVDEKHFYNPTGEYKGSERINIEKYAIEEGKRYFFSGKMAPTQNYHCVAYLNGEEEWIGNDSYRGGSEHSWDKKPLTIPTGAAYICLQVARSYTELWNLYSLETQPWDLGGVNEAIEDLDNRVTVIEQGSQAETLDTKLMKVVIKDGEILVRSRHSDTEDILIRMKDNKLYGSDKRKNSLTLNSVYIAPKETLSETDMIDSQYEIVSVEDSVGALGVVGFYYLYAQHGWTIPCGSNSNNLFSQADIGSVWKGARGEAYNNKEFVVAHVDNSKVYFVPVCELGPNGVYISSWDKDTDSYPTSFTYDRGGEDGHHTGTINLNTDRFDLCVQTSSRKYVVDGIEVGNGTYFCDDFVFNEYVLGHNPATVQPPTNWFEETIPYNGELVNWCRSFVFKGSSVTLNESIDVVNPFELSVFYGCVPQMPMQYSITDGDVTVTYNSYTFIPKVKRDGRDAPFETNNGHATVTGSKNISHLYDVNNLPDRIITFLKNDVIGYKVGMASGLSLVHGITTKTNRNLLLRDYNSTIYTFGGATDSIKNKFFTKTLVPEAFDNNIVTTAFVKDFSCYYCWYNPNNNEDGLQVYTYKDGNSYVVYVHAWEEFDKVAINLPPYLNGLSVSEIIEKTDGAELLNDVISCNKLYCSFSNNLSGEKNYIVFQVK